MSFATGVVLSGPDCTHDIYEMCGYPNFYFSQVIKMHHGKMLKQATTVRHLSTQASHRSRPSKCSPLLLYSPRWRLVSQGQLVTALRPLALLTTSAEQKVAQLLTSTVSPFRLERASRSSLPLVQPSTCVNISSINTCKGTDWQRVSWWYSFR